jgi:hypothetical protein
MLLNLHRVAGCPVSGMPNDSLSAQVPDQTDHRPLLLHCACDLAPSACFSFHPLSLIFIPFRGSQTLRERPDKTFNANVIVEPNSDRAIVRMTRQCPLDSVRLQESNAVEAILILVVSAEGIDLQPTD